MIISDNFSRLKEQKLSEIKHCLRECQCSMVVYVSENVLNVFL